MKKTFSKTTALLFTTLFSLSVFASDSDLTPQQILNEMTKAINQLDYEIAFVQTTPSNMDSFRYRHIKLDDKTYAQLVTLDGEQQEIIQRGNLVSYFQPNSPAFTLQSSHIVDALPAVIRVNFDQLAPYYDFVRLGKNRIAGRFVDTIRILPKDDFRYQYLIFVDEENHLLLRSDMLDREGQLLDQFRVVTLYIDSRLKTITDYLNKVALPPLLNNEEQKIGVSPVQKQNWRPNWLPQGFTLVRHSQEVNDQEVIDSALFSDGLFTFNLYVANADTANTQENTWKQGAYTIYSETIGDKEITFIGQLPIAAAKRIVQEVRFN